MTSGSPLDNILREIPNLDRKDLKQLKLKIEFLLQNFKNDVTPSLSSFYDSLNQKMSDYGHGSVYLGMFKKTRDFKHLEAGFEKVDQFITDNFKSITKTQRKRLYDIFSDILLSDMTTIVTTITMSTLSRNVFRIPELVNKAFPDYKRCGLLKSILL